VRPVVYFDGEEAGGGRPRTGTREVEVRFTPAGITADDELVLAVEATDEPVLVVTDDRELRARLLASGADVIGTAPFLWAAG
jgi:predicted RNA-binding protein with PIN domain